MNPKRADFLEFCSVITGYSAFDLEGTGLVDEYHALLGEILGPELTAEFERSMKPVVGLPDLEAREDQVSASFLPPSVLWPVVSGLISLWYLGTWTQLPDAWYGTTGLPVPGPGDPGRTHVPTEGAYTEQLSYRTAGAHPPGAKPTGFGSWGLPPVFSLVAEMVESD